jgi:hypothetical protein
MENSGTFVTTPDWLIPSPDVPMDERMTIKLVKQMTDQLYETLFEHALEKLAGGTVMTDIVKEYHTPVDIAKFRAWIHRDSKRKARYYEAQELFADALQDEIFRIADGTDTPEDAQRSALRLQYRKWLMSCMDRRRFGDTKQVEITENKTTNIRMILEKRERQLLGETIDGEFTVSDERSELSHFGEDAQ